MSRNYIEDTASAIYEVSRHDDLTETSWWANCDHKALYRIYAVLCLAKGEAVTSEDVHDAWTAWQIEAMPEHRSAKPFVELTPEVQAYDDKYRDAIHAVARDIRLVS